VLFRHRVRGAEGHAMPKRPEKQIPWWLTIDVTIILVGLVIIAVGIWIAPW
jgi:hypothetical protein